MASNALPIIDAHHHYWDPARNHHPWLCDEPMITFRYGDYSSIRGRFMPEDYAALTGHHDVVATVTMEGEWDERDPVAESAWMTRVGREYGGPAAHVARAFFHHTDADEILAAHSAYPIVRGIRHKPTAAEAPDRIVSGTHGSMSDPNWRSGYAHLAPNGLHFELQTPWWHIGELLDLIEAFPDTPVVINHCFMPADRSPEALAGWRNAVVQASRAPQVTMKISGIGIPGRPWQLEDQRPIIAHCLEAFGTERCMIASNFPVDSLCGTFQTIYDGFLEATVDLSNRERQQVFHDTAIRIYRLDIKPISTDEV